MRSCGKLLLAAKNTMAPNAQCCVRKPLASAVCVGCCIEHGERHVSDLFTSPPFRLACATASHRTM